MKKQLLAMLSLLIALAMLAACGSTGASSALEASSAPAETAEAVEPAAETDVEAVEDPAAEQSAAEEASPSAVEEPVDTYVDEGPFDQPEVLSVKAIGCVDVEGPKLRAVAVEYGVDLSGAELDETTYDLSGYFKDSVAAEWNNGDGQVGDITRVYINDRPAVDGTGKDNGRFAIIEVYTDYVGTSEIPMMSDALATLTVSVTQTKDLTTEAGYTVPASEEAYLNYTEGESSGGWFGGSGNTINPDGYLIPDIDSFQYFTDDPGVYRADGPAFVGHDCFDEKTGESYEKVSVSYALSLPEGYHEDGKYAMVVLDNPAAMEGTHPIQSVLTSRSPALYASNWAQDVVRNAHGDEGIEGLIVVVPVVTARVDDNACSPAQYDALVQLWDYLIETYHVDENHVYGSGQSVGGMVLLETNRNRDNYFAGLMLYEDQWAQNYYKDMLFARNMMSSAQTAASAPFHYPRTNGNLTWDHYLDVDGSPVTEGHDPNNYYFLISDDNILIMNRLENYLSNDSWQELAYLYEDLAGYTLEHHVVPQSMDLAQRDEDIAAYLARDNALGLNWVSIEGGSNGYSCRQVLAGYEWLLSQERQDEIHREKLDLNKPFVLAEEQILDESRLLHYTDADGNALYFKTGKTGAGTQFYNTVLLPVNGAADAIPGWLPEGMSWETGVEGASIASVTPIGTDAVAIEYDGDMAGLVVNLKGDPIIGLDGSVRSDIEIIMDPYDFYDKDGNRLDVAIQNIYVNSTAALNPDAERQSGSGRYVIVEFESAATAEVTGVVQRTTIRTDTLIASASPWMH